MILASLKRRASGVALILALSLALPQAAWAAISASTILEIEVGGSDTVNGGGFDPGNSSMATDLAATSGNTASPVVTSASYNFASRDVGAWLFVQSGTNWTPGWYKIASVASNAATLTAGVGTVNLYNGQTQLNTSAGCASTASPTSGKWSIDYSQQTSAGISYTDMVIGATTTQYTSAGNPVGPNIVGNIISVTSGTGFTVQRVQVSSVSGTTATCDKSLGTASSTGGNGGLGGCFATPGAAAAVAVSQNGIFIKYSATAYTSSSISTNVANGSVHLNGGSVANMGYFVGYNTTRHQYNTDASRPTMRAGVNSVLLCYAGNAQQLIRNILLDNPSAFTGVVGVQMDFGNMLTENCQFSALAYAVKVTNAQCSTRSCYALNCTTQGFETAGYGRTENCVAKGCDTGFLAGSGVTSASIENCIDINGSGTSSFILLGNVTVKNCVSYGLTGTSDCFAFSSGTGNSAAINCIAVNGAAYGFSIGGSGHSNAVQVIDCAGYNNASGNIRTGDLDARNVVNFQVLSGSPFTNAGSGDFSLNTTAGAGAACRAAGFPATYPGLSTSSYPDIGAAQHPDPSTSGTGKKAGPGGGRVGWLDRPDVIPFPLVPQSRDYLITRKAG